MNLFEIYMLAKILCFLNIGPWLKKNFTVLVAVILLVCCGLIVLLVWLGPPFLSSLIASQRSKISTVIGASLSEPHIDHDNGPRTRNNGMYLCMYVCIYLSMYLSMYHLPRVCRTLHGFRDPCMP